MLIIKKGEIVVNMTQVFSMRLSGQAGRVLLFRGSDVLSAEMPFGSVNEAKAARDAVIDAHINGDLFVDLDKRELSCW